MKRKYKLNEPEISDEQILRHKDFDKVLKGFNDAGGASKFYNKWLLALIVSLGVGTAIVVGGYGFLEEKPLPASAQPLEVERSETAVFQRLSDLPESKHFEDFEIYAREGGQLIASNGTQIFVPANAFADANGNEVSDQVTVRVRRIESLLDEMLHSKFAANTDNMQYESVWTYEVIAQSEGEVLSLKKPIKVVFDSDSDVESYTVNSITANHRFVAKANYPKTYVQRKMVGMNKPALVDIHKPILADENAYLFTIDIDAVDFPELKRFANGLFAVNTDLVKFDPMLYEIGWTNMKLQKTTVPHNYKLSLIKKDTTVVLPVYQVFNKNDYDKEMAAYNKAHKNDQTMGLGSDVIVDKTKREFETTELGVLSYEKKLEMEDYEYVKLKVADQNGSAISFSQVYLAERGAKRLLSYNSSEVQVAPGREYSVWATTSGGTLLIPENAVWYNASQLSEGIILKKIDAGVGVESLQNALRK